MWNEGDFLEVSSDELQGALKGDPETTSTK